MSRTAPAVDQLVHIDRIEIRRLMLPFAGTFEARHGHISERDIVVARIDSELGVGWGECAALPEPTYTDEFAGGAFAVLSDELAPRLVRHELSAANLQEKLAMVPGHPMAKASLEMALLDLVLKSRSVSLADWLGASRSFVPAGATVGIMSLSETHSQVAQLRSQGFQRIKLKVGSAADLDLVADLCDQFPDINFQIDPNGGCKPEDISKLVEIAERVSVIEQPFDSTQVEAARQLVAQVSIPIAADEPIDSLEAAARLVNDKACSAVAVKPPRLGGLINTKEIQQACIDWNIPMSAGGMFESGLGRHSLAAVAAMDGFSIPGDLSPARRWIEVDPWPDVEMVTDDQATGISGQIVLPTGPGVAPPPDLQILESVTTGTTMVS